MPKPLGLGLQKEVLELVLADGMKNKLAPEVRPDGQLFDVTNAEIQLVGKMSRRKGFTSVDSHTIGPEVQTTLDGTYLKLFQRDGELCAISNLSVSVGSGVGSRDTGDTIFSFSPELNGWKPHAKVPRCTLTAYTNFATGTQNGVNDCAVTDSGVSMVGWYGRTANGFQGTFVRIVDLNTNATILDTTNVGGQYTVGVWGSPKMQCLAIGSRLYVVYMQGNVGDVLVRYYDTSNRTGVMTPAVASSGSILFTGSVDWDVGTDGTNFYIVSIAATGVVTVVTRDSSLNFISSFTPGTWASVPKNVAMDVRLGLISLVYTLADDTVHFEQFTTGGVRTGSRIDVGFTVTRHSQVAVLNLSSSRCAVFAHALNLAGPATYCRTEWRPINVAAGASTPADAVVGHNHVRMAGHPFLMGGRVCVIFVGWDDIFTSGDYGYVLTEIDFTTSLLFALEVPLPVATFGQDIANYWWGNIGGQEIAFPRGAVSGNKWYYFARFLTEAISLANSDVANAEADSTLQLMQLDFADNERWKDAPMKQMAVLGSALPTCYDGRVGHECGFFFRPRIWIVTPTASGSLVNGKTYFFRVVYSWTDSFGNRWFSQPSRAAGDGEVVSFTADVTNQSCFVSVRPLALSAKMANSNFEQQDIQILLFMTRADEPLDYFLYDVHHQGPGGTANAIINFTVNAEPPLGAEEIYTAGGELENYCPPPAVCITAHRDRLLAISDLSNTLWYTKPATLARGVEWALEQQVPLPERGMAVVSNEAAAIIFTQNDTYSLEGYGPSATGQPPDAFGRLIQVSSQIGLFERNAALNTPVGIIFRARQGWYALKNTMELSYIGADVEGSMLDTDSVVNMEVDQTRAVVRIVMTPNGGRSYVLNYWYDTNRWTRDTYEGNFIQDSLVIGADYYMILGGGKVLKYDATGNARLDGDTAGYLMSVETGWFTVKNLMNIKRVWRVYAAVRNNAPAETDATDLQMTVYADWNDVTPIATRVFLGSDISPLGFIQMLRCHLPVQKLKAIKVRLSEVFHVPGAANSKGLDFVSLGFELGLKRGGPKQPAAQTQ